MADTDARYRAVMDTSIDGILAVDAHGRIALANATLERMFGYVRDELIGLPVESLIADGRRDHIAHRVINADGSPDRAFGLLREVAARRKDGSTFPVDIVLNQVECAGERLVRASVRDLNEHRRLEDRLRQTEKMEAVGRLAGGVAHDFNNLLTVIIGSADLLLNRMTPDDPARDEVLQILEAADRAAALTQQLLAFGRRQMLMPVVLRLHDIAHEMAPILRRVIPESIAIDVATDARTGRVLADRSQMEQIILNLVFNARDAMPAGGHLKIATADALVSEVESARIGYPDGPYVRLSVSDTGTGMNAEVQSKIFEPFFTTRELGKGTGLGLASVHGIVSQSGGWIEVKSAEGVGTTFSVFLPRVNESETPTA